MIYNYICRFTNNKSDDYLEPGLICRNSLIDEDSDFSFSYEGIYKIRYLELFFENKHFKSTL